MIEFLLKWCCAGISRWLNFYVEGVHRSVLPPVSIDGIYFDGIAFSRDTMLRYLPTLLFTYHSHIICSSIIHSSHLFLTLHSLSHVHIIHNHPHKLTLLC
jgi:hypothetical protein